MLTKSKFACCEPGKMKASNSLEMLKFTPCQGSRLYLKAAHTNSQDGDIEPVEMPRRRFLCWQKLICLERNSSQGDVHICVYIHLEEDDSVEDKSSSRADSEADHHLAHAGDHFVPN